MWNEPTLQVFSVTSTEVSGPFVLTLTPQPFRVSWQVIFLGSFILFGVSVSITGSIYNQCKVSPPPDTTTTVGSITREMTGEPSTATPMTMFDQDQHPPGKYRPRQVVKFTFLTYNTMSDIAFAWTLQQDEKGAHFATASWAFIAFPFVVSLIAWVHFKRRIFRGSASLHFEVWELKFDKAFFLFSLLSGSAYGAFALAKSFLFDLDVFNIPVEKSDEYLWVHSRLYYSVMVEDVPQFIIQVWWIILQGGVKDVITAAAIGGSLVSMILGIYNAVNAGDLSETVHEIVQRRAGNQSEVEMANETTEGRTSQ